MLKKRILGLVKEYGVLFDELMEICIYNLVEEMVIGKGKNLWLLEDG